MFVVDLMQIEKRGGGKTKNENGEAVWWIAGTQKKDNFFSKAILILYPADPLLYYPSIKGSSF